ncbi:MAG: glycosyltransferase family protein [Cyclobacteriaceae bacterium]
MKILYAVQGTGNGHMSRAQDVISALMKRASVDVLVSGIQADLELPFPVKYRFRGLSFIFGKKGGVDLLATYKSYRIRKLLKEIKSCPVEKYDLVINDFEPISAWACKLKGVKSIALSHQGALRSKLVPKPFHFDLIGWLVLKYYAPCRDYYSFHFKKYDRNIYSPIIRNEIREHPISNEGHFTVYLPSYGDQKLIKVLSKIKKVKWQVFSKHSKKSYSIKNVAIHPIDKNKFTKSIASATGVLCGAGFETPAEALYLSKKLMVIPMAAQYEQHFNAKSLADLGVPVIPKLSKKHLKMIKKWTKAEQTIPVYFPNETQSIIDKLLQEHLQQEYVGKMQPSTTQLSPLPKFKLS